MKSFRKAKIALAIGLVASLSHWFIPSYAHAGTARQSAATAQSAIFSAQDLDRMLAPIALYPDSLLSQILMAATYPLEVVEAQRWSVAHSHYSGERAVREVAGERWDPSVKSLLAFPRILTQMSENLKWTQQLGDAFLAQQAQVSVSVQRLRQRAVDAGNLRSNDRIRVYHEPHVVRISYANPRLAYVPYYNPREAYGRWWWPGEPVYWATWPGYYRRAGVTEVFFWDNGYSLSDGFFYGDFDWHRQHVTVVNVSNYYYTPRIVIQKNYIVRRDGDRVHHRWHHDASHRRGVSYHSAELAQEYGRTTASAEKPAYVVAPVKPAESHHPQPEAKPVDPPAGAGAAPEGGQAQNAGAGGSTPTGSAAGSTSQAGSGSATEPGENVSQGSATDAEPTPTPSTSGNAEQAAGAAGAQGGDNAATTGQTPQDTALDAAGQAQASATSPEVDAPANGLVSVPETAPEPERMPAVVPEAAPAPAPESTPESEPVRAPEPVSMPEPEPVSMPEPEPMRAPEPVRMPEPEPVRAPEPVRMPEPEPVRAPEPVRTPEPPPERAAEPAPAPDAAAAGG